MPKPTKQTPPRPVIVVQQIEVHWTKASRGGAGAVRRNAIPEAFLAPMQTIERNGLALLYQRLYMDEYFDFVPKEKLAVNPITRPLALGCVQADGSAEQAWVSFAYNGRCGGAPDRSGVKKTLLLPLNEWGQIAYNGRFVYFDDGGWYYEKMVVNVGLFETPTNDVFTRSVPNRRFLAMGHLI